MKKKQRNKKSINYSVFQSPHYFDKLFVFFLIICFIFTLAIVDSSNGFNLFFVMKYVVVLFLILTVAVLYEFKNKSDYISPMDIISIRQFFNDFNHSNKREDYVHKYNAKTLKQLKKNIKKNLKYHLTNIVKKNELYELHICEKPSGDKLYLYKFFLNKNNHKLTIQEENGKIKILRIS